ncbi:LysE family transporter [Algiphilus sp. W345]|uniref:LysE family transporter n=1 Tax=Banduia mediterranea TaxID=3075609 RepID=A0ABU2WKI8_9GAMM|nr:LysE family transporter [Algiphilus sp. W345]MDT0498386.1 LysE family transporter [Algiphilus sp. W345]
MSQADWSMFVTVMLAHALGVISPGPDFAVVIRQSLAYGRAAGVWTAAGIGSGILFHVAYGLFGLGWAVQAFPPLLDVAAVLGAAVLIWIGFKSLRARPMSAQTLAPDAVVASRKSYGLGLATNLLNPKAALFFVALFSAVATGTQNWALRLTIGLWLPLATFAWFAALALMLSHAGLRRRLQARAHLIDRAMGVVLFGLGAVVLFEWARSL